MQGVGHSADPLLYAHTLGYKIRSAGGPHLTLIEVNRWATFDDTFQP